MTSTMPNLFVVYGPAGSGKSALVKVLLRELYESAHIDRGNVHKWIMQVLTIICFIHHSSSL